MAVEPAPTFVVGVGQAGINVINRIEQGDGLGWGEEYDKYFDYAVVDSSQNEVRNAPDSATKLFLDTPTQYATQDQHEYPYLTPELDIEGKGAMRQRPVGRYKLDNMAQPSWDAHYEKLSNAVQDFVQQCQDDPDIKTRQLNVVHIHSLGGGTGSGTFPLLGYMLKQIVDNVQRTESTDVYSAGIGVVPEITDPLDVFVPPGDNRYYANTYSAMSDLIKLLEADTHEPLPIHLYAKHAQQDGVENFVLDQLTPQHEIDSSPYRHYFLIGVDEDQITGDNKRTGPETYRAMVNNSIVAALYGISMYGNELDNWLETETGFDRFGSFGQTQLSIPIDEIRQYCDLQEDVETLEELIEPEGEDIEGELREDRRSKIDERDRLQRILDDPTTVLEQRENSEDFRASIQTSVQRTIDIGMEVNSSTGDLDEIRADVLDRYEDDTLLAYTMYYAEQYIDEQGEEIIEEWRAFVNEKYKQWEIATEDGYGINVTTTAEKAKELNRYLNEKIDELADEVEDDDSSGLLSSIKDSLTGLVGDGDEYEEWLERFKNSRTQFRDLEQRREDINSLKQETRSRKAEILNDTIRPRIETLQDEIEELRLQIERTEEQLEEARKDKESKLDEITDAEYGRRVGLLALDEQKVRSDLDHETLEEELDSVYDFYDNGFLARNLEDTIEDRIDQAYAWDSALMTWREDKDTPIGEREEGIREVWMLHSDENTDLPQFEIINAGRHELRRSGEDDDVFPTFSDPYTLQFVTYTLDAPLKDLRLYAELEEAAEEGILDELIDEWVDHKLAFAYPEWYDRDIQKVFQIETSEELPRLPELDIDAVDVDKEGGELKNWLSSYGIASYLWHADEWNDYQGHISVDGIPDQQRKGWKYILTEADKEITYSDMRDYVPSEYVAKRWIAGQVDWETVLEETLGNLLDDTGIQAVLVPEE